MPENKHNETEKNIKNCRFVELNKGNKLVLINAQPHLLRLVRQDINHLIWKPIYSSN